MEGVIIYTFFKFRTPARAHCLSNEPTCNQSKDDMTLFSWFFETYFEFDDGYDIESVTESANYVTDIFTDLWAAFDYILMFGFGGAFLCSYVYAYAMRIPIVVSQSVSHSYISNATRAAYSWRMSGSTLVSIDHVYFRCNVGLIPRSRQSLNHGMHVPS